MCEEEPNWTFPTFPIVIEDDELGINIPKELTSMGYTSHESIKDAEWLQRLSSRDSREFEELTGYRVPTHVTCDACGECDPRIMELSFMGEDGDAIKRTIL
jgi:hypothetical protein